MKIAEKKQSSCEDILQASSREKSSNTSTYQRSINASDKLLANTESKEEAITSRPVTTQTVRNHPDSHPKFVKTPNKNDARVEAEPVASNSLHREPLPAKTQAKPEAKAESKPEKTEA